MFTVNKIVNATIATLIGLTLVLASLLLTSPVSAQDIVGSSGCVGVDCSACHLVNMANGIIVWIIGFLVLMFAVLMVVAGFGLVTSGGNPSAKTAAKDKFVNALIGLLIVLSAWLLIDTIIRGLVSDDGYLSGSVSGRFFWSEVQCTPPSEVRAGDRNTIALAELRRTCSSPGSASYEELTALGCVTNECTTQGCLTSCTNVVNYNGVNMCVSGPNNLQVTGPAPTGCSGGTCAPLTIPCSNSNSCSISPDLVDRLTAFHAAAGVSGARVTEAMPPTRNHRAGCHQNGTCVDYSKAGGMTPTEVQAVINAARANNLRPVYEVQTNAQRDQLVRGGVSSSDILVLGTHISAPHFSIYGF